MWNLHQLSFLFFKKYSCYDVFSPIDLVFGSREACDAINGVELEDLGDNVLPDPNLLIISLPTKVTHQRSFYSMNIMCDRQRMVNFSLMERRKIWRFCFLSRKRPYAAASSQDFDTRPRPRTSSCGSEANDNIYWIIFKVSSLAVNCDLTYFIIRSSCSPSAFDISHPPLYKANGPGGSSRIGRFLKWAEDTFALNFSQSNEGDDRL